MPQDRSLDQQRVARRPPLWVPLLLFAAAGIKGRLHPAWHRIRKPGIRVAPVLPTSPAVDGKPPGLRTLLVPEALTKRARQELERDLHPGQRTIEMQYAFSSGQHGHLRRLRGAEHFPACYELMHVTESLFGLPTTDVDRVQVMVRMYTPPQELRLHVDSMEMFEEPVLSCVLRCDAEGDGLVLRRKETWRGGGEAIAVAEKPGVAVCLEGPARYEFGHEVPPVTAPRLSITWRWFRPEYLRKLTEVGCEQDRHKEEC